MNRNLERCIGAGLADGPAVTGAGSVKSIDAPALFSRLAGRTLQRPTGGNMRRPLEAMIGLAVKVGPADRGQSK